jgi:hypothetical protein
MRAIRASFARSDRSSPPSLAEDEVSKAATGPTTKPKLMQQRNNLNLNTISQPLHL